MHIYLKNTTFVKVWDNEIAESFEEQTNNLLYWFWKTCQVGTQRLYMETVLLFSEKENLKKYIT